MRKNIVNPTNHKLIIGQQKGITSPSLQCSFSILKMQHGSFTTSYKLNFMEKICIIQFYTCFLIISIYNIIEGYLPEKILLVCACIPVCVPAFAY